ncbi:MAG: hypothetical protein ACJA0N_001824, partial [Pseudohongiellaceae bacterium]
MATARSIATEKYLKHYAEPESQMLDNFPSTFQQCLAIPMYRESPEALKSFCQFAEHQQNTLLIVIINRPKGNPDTAWALTLQQSLPKQLWQTHDGLVTLHTLKHQSGILFVDRCIQGASIDKEQGVGLARKIGCDIACQLIHDKKIASPFIFNTDADAQLPVDYFSITKTACANTAALLLPYQHVSVDGDKPHLATQLYELSLAYYVEGLRWAESPYAYHTLGSIICVNSQHYAMVRGFPKRAGAEDFYLLNKLAKTGDIVSLKKPTIKLICRQSNRVPFGTGPAVTRIIERGEFEEMPFYDPYIFYYLKTFNQLIILSAKDKNLDIAIKSLNLDPIKQELLINSTEVLKLAAAISHAHQQGNTEDKRLRHLHTWFDAFKTLKFLHFIRDQQHPMISYKDWKKRIINE